MEIKNMFDPAVKRDIIERIQRLEKDSKARWGKMNVGQMLAHVQKPLQYLYGEHSLKANFLLRLIGPLFKSLLYNEKPYRQGTPTDPSYIIRDEKDFETGKSDLLQLLSRFAPENISEQPHPIFGKLTREQWSKATWKHLDHHLRQFGV